MSNSRREARMVKGHLAKLRKNIDKMLKLGKISTTKVIATGIKTSLFSPGESLAPKIV